MTIGRLIEGRGTSVETCNVSTTVREAARLLAERRIGALPVMDGDKLVGMFSERDVIYKINEHGAEILDRPVSDAMTAPAVTVNGSTTVLSALSLMTKRRIRHLPVVSAGRMIGFVSIGDLVKYRIDKIESEAAALRDYIQMA